jgi:hypothetical protein
METTRLDQTAAHHDFRRTIKRKIFSVSGGVGQPANPKRSVERRNARIGSLKPDVSFFTFAFRFYETPRQSTAPTGGEIQIFLKIENLTDFIVQ